jgi:uncharacterized cysteine cluster protein YcgN (CxxCxxCC family)
MENKIITQEVGRYQAYMQEKEKAWEGVCRRCGACCGAYEDPCSQLARDKEKKFYCKDYENRFGPQRSCGGREFSCVPIRQVLHNHWNHDHLCAYKSALRNIWIPE